MKNFKLFSGTSNLPLAQEVAKILGVKLGKVEIIRFADTESRVWVEEEVKNQTVFLLQSFSPPVDENLVEFLLLADAIKRAKPKKMIAVVPYYGYARQDKIFRPGEALSAQVVARLIGFAGFDKLITVHLHSLNILDFFKIPVVHLSTVSIFTEAFNDLKKGSSEWVAVAPDEVALAQVKKLAKPLGFQTAVVEKTRDYSQKDKPKALDVIGKVSGKNAIMFDDLSSSGGTIVGGAKLLKEAGVGKILVALSHLVVGSVAERLTGDKNINRLYITDTISYTGKKLAKLEIVSVAPLIARAIGDSV